MNVNQGEIAGYLVKVGSLYVKDACKGIHGELISVKLTINKGEAAWLNRDNAVRTANRLHGTVMTVNFIDWHPNLEDE